MIEKIVYKIMKNKIKEMQQYNYDNDTLNITMRANIQKYLDKLQVKDTDSINLVNPTDRDIILYLVYLLEAQKNNDIEVLDNIQKIINFKIDIHKSDISKDEITNIINVYKIQIRLK